ncbi:homoserine kinase [Bifidobacterium sp. ESL0790]|uniref:homoserine kinase n=1 Tax=Bifidobacterium sp. ESL0790 TaxID=2983233 RepID=UPI0023F7D9EE|nr:homoserine kinase [Bifidobacterium sp. ESL0790]WEV73250.1 homoserine kinase [Bifidobacterium sp. ESL0790]
MAAKAKVVKVRVPATSANLGSGFDTVGLALDFHDELTFTANDVATNGSADVDGENDGASDTAARVIIHGEGEDSLPRDETHLVVSTFRRACQALGLRRFGFTLEAHNNIPQARGMGSSAEAIVSGIAAAWAFAQGNNELDREAIFQMAASIEGHPDNVAPAVFGGLTASWNFETSEGVGSVAIPDGQPLQKGFHTVNYPVDPAMTATVFVPDYELSTERARQALPASVPYKDAIFNVSRVALLPEAMNPRLRADSDAGAGASQNVSDRSAAGPLSSLISDLRDSAKTFSALASRSNSLLFAATQDRLHQPYRKALMAPSWSLIEKLRAKGFAAAVSGAGPCVLVLHYGDASALIDKIASEELSGSHWRVLHLPVSPDGVQVSL